MNRTNNILQVLLLVLFFFMFFLVDAKDVFCLDEAEDRSDQQEDKVASDEEGTLEELETTDLVELLKQRALLRLKKRKKEQIFKFKINASVMGGYETNVNNDSAHKGDLFTSQSASINWLPTFNKYISLNVIAFSVNQIYSDLTDNNYLYNTISAGVRFYPFEGGKLRMEPGIAYDTIWYPFSVNSSYSTIKYFLKAKNFSSRIFSSDFKLEYSMREYGSKKARNPSRVYQDFVREDERYTIEASATRKFGKFSVRLKEKIYRNTSNDLYQDWNDYYAFKSYLTVSVTFLEDKSLYLSFTPSFERKNYRERQATNMARFDDRYNYKFAARYKLNKNYTLKYKFDYWRIDSNRKTIEYNNLIHQVGVSVRF